MGKMNCDMERTRHGDASIIWYLHRNFDVKQSMENCEQILERF